MHKYEKNKEKFWVLDINQISFSNIEHSELAYEVGTFFFYVRQLSRGLLWLTPGRHTVLLEGLRWGHRLVLFASSFFPHFWTICLAGSLISWLRHTQPPSQPAYFPGISTCPSASLWNYPFLTRPGLSTPCIKSCLSFTSAQVSLSPGIELYPV